MHDLAAIAAHRGWTTIQLRGEDDLRREIWTEARALGLEVKNYKPRERDEQELQPGLEIGDDLEAVLPMSGQALTAERPPTARSIVNSASMRRTLPKPWARRRRSCPSTGRGRPPRRRPARRTCAGHGPSRARSVRVRGCDRPHRDHHSLSRRRPAGSRTSRQDASGGARLGDRARSGTRVAPSADVANGRSNLLLQLNR